MTRPEHVDILHKAVNYLSHEEKCKDDIALLFIRNFIEIVYDLLCELGDANELIRALTKKNMYLESCLAGGQHDEPPK